MIRRSITLKLFFVLVILLVTFTLFAVNLQAHYFTAYYQNHLDEALKGNMKDFARDYIYAQSKDAKDNLLNSFIQSNVAMAAIVDSNGKLRYTYDFNMVVRTPYGQVINIPIEDLGTLREILSLDILVNDEIYIEGLYDKSNGNLTYITYMAKNGKKAFVDSNNDKQLASKYPDFKSNPKATDSNMIYMAFKGTVLTKMLPGPNVVGLNSRKDVLKEALNRIDPSLYRSALLRRDFEDISYTSLLTTSTFKTFIYPISGIYGGEFLIAMTPRKPIDEISSMMVPFYQVVTFSSILAAIIVAIVFSTSITKPLVRLNQAAIKLSHLDFDTDVVIPSGDELGSLSRSLSSLALNLRAHMEALTVTNRQLQTELEKERNLDQMRREFVSSVSHELKTPLAIIRGYTEGIQDGLNPQKTPHYLHVILDEIQRMDTMVMDMLDLSRLESLVQLPAYGVFDLEPLIHEIKMKFELQIKAKGLNFELALDKTPLMAIGDQACINQVLSNFMSNAIRHANENGQIKLSVTSTHSSSSENKAPHPSYHLIEIYNDGELIPEDKLFRVWERFYRIDEDRGRESGGTGLGLSIVKTILEQHQSLYGLRNDVTGVTAHFTLLQA